MANELCLPIVQSVQSETSNPTVTTGYSLSPCTFVSIVNEITTGEMKDGSGQTVHVMKSADNDAGIVLIMAGTIDAGEQLILPIRQEVGEATPEGLILPIQQEVGGLAVLILPIQQTVKKVEYLILPIQQEVITGTNLTLPIRQVVAIFDSLTLPIRQEVEAITGQLVLPITQEVITGQQLTLPITQAVMPVPGVYTSDLYSQAQFWTASVFLAGTDISAAVTGTLSINMEEGTARLANLSYLPAAGEIDQCALIGDSITINFILTDSAGAQVSSFRRFTGVVDSIGYDPTTSIVTLDCTDDLQEIVVDMERTVIASMIDGHYSADVYDEEDTDNWEYAEDMLLTVPKSMDISPSGNIRVTDWAAKGTADFILDDGQLKYKTPAVQLADDSELVNKINLELDYRFNRAYYRSVNVRWTYPRTFCQYVSASTELPNTDMVISALEGVGWGIASLNTTPLRQTSNTLLQCIAGQPAHVGGGLTTGQGYFAWSNPYYPDLLVGFVAKVYKEWNQSITEKPTHSITAPQSINVCEEHEETLTVTVDIEFDEEDGEVDLTTEETSAIGVLNLSNASCNLDSGDDEQPYGGYGVSRIGSDENRRPPVGSVLNNMGDYYLDSGDQQRYDDAATVAFAQARVKILDSHRLNLVSFNRPFLPIDVSHTVEVDVTRLHARGKVKTTSEELDTESGSATIQVTMSISRSSDEVVVEQVAGSLPSRTASFDYLDEVAQHNPSIILPTQIGNWQAGNPSAGPDISAGSQYCDDMLGFSGNYHYISNLAFTPKELKYLRTAPLPGSQERNPRLNIVGENAFNNANDYDWTADTSITGEAWPHRLSIEMDGVQEELTDAVEVEGGDQYTTQIPNELLVLNQP